VAKRRHHLHAARIRSTRPAHLTWLWYPRNDGIL
jgi:hypothetical protein